MSASPEQVTGPRAHRVARGSRPYKKVSVTLPADLLDDIRAEVGPGNLSSYLAEAVERDRRRAALRHFLDVMEQEHGPVPEQEVQDVLRQWRGQP